MANFLKTLPAFLVLLGFSCVHAQVIDTNGTFTWQGALTQTQCSTFLTSGLFEGICGYLGNTEVERITCDVHCQCAHNSKWGHCVPRPEGGPVGTGFGNQLCTCYYDDVANPPPIGWVKEPRNSAGCLAFKAVVVANLCGGPTPRCMGDCVCGHNFKTSYCTVDTDGSQYCICTNDQVPPVGTTQNPVGNVIGIIGG